MSEEEVGLDLDEKYGSNPKAEIEGVWQPLGGGAAVKVARLGNKQAQKAWRKMPKAFRNSIDEGALEGVQGEQFLCDFMAKHILMDWKGLAVKGKSLPDYSPEHGKKFLLQFRRFRDRIWELSADDELFNVEAEEDAKNLPELSTGGSGTMPTPLKPSAVGS